MMKSALPLSVLCVDDDEDSREMLAILLGRLGVQVDSAGTAAEALHLSETKPFDLYLLDSWLPDLDGFELCRKLRERAIRMPILFFSGAAYEVDRRKGIEAGANAYVFKPNIDELLETLSNFIATAAVGGAKTNTRAMAFSRPSAMKLSSFVLMH
jgi:DNA-binding response OmpR family regulator